MKVPTVSVCCCGCTLKTGCIIIGSLGAISALFYLILNSVQADAIGKIIPDADAKVVVSHMAVQWMLIIRATLACAATFLHIGLIYGTCKYKASYVYLWVMFYSVMVPINLMCYFSLAIICFTSFGVGIGFAVLLFEAVTGALDVYCLIVVYSYYVTLQSEVTQLK